MPEAHALLGAIAAIYDYDWKESERRFRLTMACDPVPPAVVEFYGFFYPLHLGRPQEAIEQSERALREDPLNLVFRVRRLLCLSAAGRSEDATRECHQMLELFGGTSICYGFLAMEHAGFPTSGF